MNRTIVALTTLVALAAFSVSAPAAIVFDTDAVFAAGTEVSFDYSYSAGHGGGPFLMTGNVTDGTTTVSDSLETFCVENNEWAYNPGTIISISKGTTSASYGTSVDTGRDLIEYGAWVYYTYKSTWSTWTDVNTAGDQNLIQDAVWWSMQGTTDKDSFTNELARNRNNASITNAVSWWTASTQNADLDDYDLAHDDFVTWVNNNGHLSNDRVFIYNMTTAPTEGPDKQDMIGLDIPGGAQVPEPASLLVWSVLGACGAGVAARRKRRGWSAETRRSIERVIDPRS